MDLYESLHKAGLTGNESRLYVALLKHGDLSAQEIARRVGMDRTLTYTVLNHLIEKGLVTFIMKDRKIFSANPPQNLLNPIDEQRVFVEDLIPRLEKFKKEKISSWDVQVFEGRRGLRSVVTEWFEHKVFNSFGATGRTYDFLYEFPRLAQQWIDQGGKARIITAPKYRAHRMTKMKTISYRYLDVKSDATTTIADDIVTIYHLAQKPMIIRIQNKAIATSYLNHFEVLWKIAKR